MSAQVTSPGAQWFALHTLSGQENKVKIYIETSTLGGNGAIECHDGAIAVTLRDVRCAMVCLDPDSAGAAPEVLKAVVRANQNTSGIYGTVIRIGRLGVGQTIRLRTSRE